VLRPISEDWDWQATGACRDRVGAAPFAEPAPEVLDLDPARRGSRVEFFHPEDDLGRISRRLRETAAKRVCLSCPVRPQCATHALTVGEEYGVWGGFTETERARLRDSGWRDTVGTDRVVDIALLDRRLLHVPQAR
jgi:WhiB family redox-sensing transcriptional regulator